MLQSRYSTAQSCCGRGSVEREGKDEERRGSFDLHKSPDDSSPEGRPGERERERERRENEMKCCSDGYRTDLEIGVSE